MLIGLPTFRLRGHYFALSMLAYPLAILYFLQYLGFQEMSLPMHRENPAAFLEFTNPHYYTVVAVGAADRRRGRLHAGGKLALRPGFAGDPAERTGGRGSGHQRPAVEDAGAGGVGHDRRGGGRLLCLRAAGGDAGSRCSACWFPRRRWW